MNKKSQITSHVLDTSIGSPGRGIIIRLQSFENEKWQKWAKEKKSDKMMDDFFGKIPTLLGLKKEDVEFEARFKHHRVEYYYTLKNSIKIK